MFFNRKDEDDEYERYMQEREGERGSELSDRSFDAYDSSHYSEPVNQQSHHEFDCGEEPCEYDRSSKDFKTASNNLRKHLMPGERIIWAGMGAAPTDKASAVTQRGFGMFWLAFSIFWTVSAFSGGGFFGLFGLPFVLIGIVLVFGKTGSKTSCAVTDQRVITVSGSGSVTAFSLRIVSNPQIFKDDKSGKFNVTFTVPMQRFGRPIASANGFFGISDGNAAYKAICDGIYFHQS